MNTLTKLQDVYCDNFIAYYRAHSIHMNILGRNFYSDHKLLQKIYEELQEHIDDIGELLRSSQEFVPETIGDILAGSDLDDSTAGASGADSLLVHVRSALEHLVMAYTELNLLATEEDYPDIENFAQGQIQTLKRFIWMLTATEE